MSDEEPTTQIRLQGAGVLTDHDRRETRNVKYVVWTGSEVTTGQVEMSRDAGGSADDRDFSNFAGHAVTLKLADGRTLKVDGFRPDGSFSDARFTK